MTESEGQDTARQWLRQRYGPYYLEFTERIMDLRFSAKRCWDTERSKAHFYGALHVFLGLPAAVLSAVSGATGLISTTGRIPAAILALGAAAMSAASAFLEPQRRKQWHDTMTARWHKLYAELEFVTDFESMDPDWGESEARATYDWARKRYFALNYARLNEGEPSERITLGTPRDDADDD